MNPSLSSWKSCSSWRIRASRPPSAFAKRWKKRVKAQRVTDPTQIFEMLRETVAEMIAGDEELHVRTKPSIILVIGVNGVGKTTTIGKIASRLRQERKKVLLAAADTFRAAAIEQLEVWAERSGSEIVKHPEGSDPASVVYDAIAAAKSRGTDVDDLRYGGTPPQ